MDLKKAVLKILEENRGKSISGTALAEQLYVTRSAIWKAIKSLKESGYIIESVTNKGYCLVENNNKISAESIYPFLEGKAKKFSIDYRETVTSTNVIAKEMAIQGAKEGTIIVANEQTEGKGRLGRTFYSPANSGVYFSIILRPNLNVEDSLLITTSVAVAVAEAIEEITNVEAKIKWVNDIFVNDKKVCGILTEGSINFENGGLNYAIVGIGINITTDVFPENIKNIAGSIISKDSNKNNIPIHSLLVAKVLNNISKCMDSLSSKIYLEKYRNKSFLIGQDILILQNNTEEYAKAIGIDDKACLIVVNEKGEERILSSGEVSVRAIHK